MSRPNPKLRFARLLPSGAAVLDVGCWDFSFARFCEDHGVLGLKHHGVDLEAPPAPVPDGYRFDRVDLETSPLPYPDSTFEGVVASHVIEHVLRPLALTDEIFRVLKPAGLIYLECPSARSCWFPSMPFRHEQNRSSSFYDDPSHVGRPQTPQSLYRLFRFYGADVVEVRHLMSASVLLRSPWLILRALATRNAAIFEETLWWGFGFAVYGIARRGPQGRRQYVLG